VSDPFGHVRFAIENLIYDSARLIDEGELEAWSELFTDDCRYCITTRDNFDQGLPVSLIDCDSHGMLRDRIVSLRQANIYNPHWDRHLIGNVRILNEVNGIYDVHSSYTVYQTTLEGESSIYSVGKYLDKIAVSDGEAKFTERIVVADTWSIPNLLATPL